MQRGGEQTVRLVLDADAERGVARLRTGAALVVAVAAVWLLALPYAVPRMLAAAGLVFATLWIARSLRQRASSLSPEQHYLELSPEALQLREGARFEQVTWAEIAALSIDEDRLLLRVERRSGPPIEIEPRYRGLGLHALYTEVEAARNRAMAGAGCAPPGDG